MPHRVRAALLAALFLAGSFGVPVADALVFHRAGSDPLAGVVHVEGVDTGHHAERCLLSHAAPAPREALEIPSVVAEARPIIQYSIPERTPFPAAAFPASTQHSRAPPA
jgi:hypothetical protein